MRRGDVNWEELAKALLWVNIVKHKNEDSGWDVMTEEGPAGRDIHKGDVGYWSICSYVDPYSHKPLTWKELALELGMFEDILTPDGHDCEICPDKETCQAYFKGDKDEEQCSRWGELKKEGKV